MPAPKILLFIYLAWLTFDPLKTQILFFLLKIEISIAASRGISVLLSSAFKNSSRVINNLSF